MKRSEINTYLAQAHAAFVDAGFSLPPFAYMAYEKWKKCGHEYDGIRRCMLGWDITDFGSGAFLRMGLTLFTLRNGDPADPDSKTYAEKLMFVRQGQVTPMHYHSRKMEDIIVRSGANLIVELWWPDENGGLSAREVTVTIDGVKETFPAGVKIALSPGQSITMTRGLYHSFFADGGPCVVGEVSMVNDDRTDNHFLTECGRFPPIEEDAVPEYCLCSEYPEAE